MRGAAAPADDKIWARHRSEADTLAKLAHLDTVLVGSALELAGAIGRHSVETISAATEPPEIAGHFSALRAALDRRGALLQIQPRP